MYLVDTGNGQPPRPLTAVEAAAYEAEKAYQRLCCSGSKYLSDEDGKMLSLLFNRVFELTGQESYQAMLAWTEQFYDRITVAPQSTIAERVYDVVAGRRSMR